MIDSEIIIPLLLAEILDSEELEEWAEDEYASTRNMTWMEYFRYLTTYVIPLGTYQSYNSFEDFI